MTFESVGASLADVEREHILDTLTRCHGNRTRAAKVLKISVRSLRMKLHYYADTGSDVIAPGQSEDILVPELADARHVDQLVVE
ncbi:MAG TPA: helix-turn-helix domain-containing protein [Xanthobacteraceae bacterium]|jgi:DNA-binding NtrC family response regulator|nr:helix-turn-helix domain-containing protein [Xanthobacteraceae bacterium]